MWEFFCNIVNNKPRVEKYQEPVKHKVEHDQFEGCPEKCKSCVTSPLAIVDNDCEDCSCEPDLPFYLWELKQQKQFDNLDTVLLSKLRIAFASDYARWLDLFVDMGGVITHAYNYPFSRTQTLNSNIDYDLYGFYVANEDFTIPEQRWGLNKIKIIVPKNIKCLNYKCLNHELFPRMVLTMDEDLLEKNINELNHIGIYNDIVMKIKHFTLRDNL